MNNRKSKLEMDLEISENDVIKKAKDTIKKHYLVQGLNRI